MARQPKLILREGAVDDVVENWPTGTFLETGSGTGYMTRKFLERGYQGACFELGQEARGKLRTNLSRFSNKIQVLDSLDELGPQKFDYLLSFEVLEHIEDDLKALLEWSVYLKSKGTILISVPAHQRKYGKSDELVGHVRRYERTQVTALLEDAGYENIEMINYGFPVSEVSRPLSNLIAKKEKSKREVSLQELSLQSSHSRQTRVTSIINLIGERPILPFRKFQRMFYKYDWADGIIATATKK